MKKFLFLLVLTSSVYAEDMKYVVVPASRTNLVITGSAGFPLIADANVGGYGMTNISFIEFESNTSYRVTGGVSCTVVGASTFVAGGTNVWANWRSAVTNGGSIGTVTSTGTPDWAASRYWHYTVTGQAPQVTLTLPAATNETMQLYVQLNGLGALGTVTATFANVYSPGGFRSYTFGGSITNDVEIFRFVWPGWWTNQTAGAWIIEQHLNNVK